MFSALTYEGATETIKALEYGAVDFFQKPESGAEGLGEVVDILVKKIVTFVRRGKVRILTGDKKPSPDKEVIKPKPSRVYPKNIDLIALGSSTGGVQAAREVIPKLPKNMKPIVWVQHMPPNFTLSLSTRLDALSPMTVKEAKHGDILQDGHCYLAPGGLQMRVQKSQGGKFRLNIEGAEKVSGHCPSCDVLFDSVADYFSSNTLGVILTGMGSDGAKGLLKMHKKGAFVIGQNEASCVVYGMPRMAAQAGAVDVEVDIKEVANEMKRVCGIN